MTDRPLTLERPAALPSSRRAFDFARGLWGLTKPGIIGLLLVTTVPTMIVAADGWPKGDFGDGLALILLTLLGGILTAGGSNTFNQWFDRDIDAIMERTGDRPLPAGVVKPWHALLWGFLLATLGGIQLALTVNLLAALLAEAAVLFYVFVYTMWLKRSTTQNIVIGGAAGSIPPLVGWAAVTGEVTWTPFILFLVIFMWTPPHFWALSLKYRDDYAKANVPMLPVVHGVEETARQILLHSLTLVASTPRLAQMGASMDAGSWRRILEEEGTRAWLMADTDKRFGPNTARHVVEWYADEGAKTSAPSVMALQGCLLAQDLTPLLPDIAVPTLILAASQDDITPLNVQEMMARQIPNAVLEVYEGVGHNMKVEIPDTLAARTLDFIEGIANG